MKNFYQDVSERTERTEQKEERSIFSELDGSPPDRSDEPRGWVFYDGECRYCIAAAKRFSPIFRKRGFVFLPLQTPWVGRRFGLAPGEPFKEMRVLTADGRNFGGADAVLFLARQVWWLWPFSVIGQLPGIHRLVDATYRWIAARRGCTHLKCNRSWGDDLVSSHNFRDETNSSLQIRIVPWAALILLPALALIARPHLASWAFMWVMAAAIFFGCKWLTLARTMQRVSRVSASRILAYLFLWVGMDAESFLTSRGSGLNLCRALPKVGWTFAKIGLGALLLFGTARLSSNELLAGWIGMAGMIFILHFGVFDLAAIFWRMAGVNARPIMNAPLKATSVAEFWGRRWNGAFNQLLLGIFFRPFARSFGPIRATLTAFVISGLIHELVISLPAGAGYGLPTGYFLLQGWGVIAQRISLPTHSGSQRRLLPRFVTLLLVAGPAFWLFHPPFVHRVVIPFMQAIGAL